MASSLRVLQWGGHIYDNIAGGSPIEIWTNTIHGHCPDGAPPTTAMVSSAAGVISTFHSDPLTRIHETVSLDWVKASNVDVATGRWLDDPTPLYMFPAGVRGGTATLTPPTFQACRASMDDQTRNARARGGFWIPRSAMEVLNNGQWNVDHRAHLADQVQVLFASLLSTCSLSVGVYSKVDHSFTSSTRLRIGSVPDIIRKRKNGLLEAYSSRTAPF